MLRRAAPAAGLLALAAAAVVMHVQHGTAPPRFRGRELLGRGGAFVAREDATALGVADDLAAQSLRRSAQMLHEAGARGRSAGREIGHTQRGQMALLSQQSRAVKLKLQADTNRAHMERVRAHLLRMRASDDTQIAKDDLDRVTALDGQLAAIKRQASDARKGFGAAAKQTKAIFRAKRAVQAAEAKVATQLKTLRARVARLEKEAEQNKVKAAEDKDDEDAEREQLASALVRRTRRERRVNASQRRLDEMQARFQAADAKAALRLKEQQAASVSAGAELTSLQGKLGTAQHATHATGAQHMAAGRGQAPHSVSQKGIAGAESKTRVTSRATAAGRRKDRKGKTGQR